MRPRSPTQLPPKDGPGSSPYPREAALGKGCNFELPSHEEQTSTGTPEGIKNAARSDESIDKSVCELSFITARSAINASYPNKDCGAVLLRHPLQDQHSGTPWRPGLATRARHWGCTTLAQRGTMVLSDAALVSTLRAGQNSNPCLDDGAGSSERNATAWWPTPSSARGA